MNAACLPLANHLQSPCFWQQIRVAHIEIAMTRSSSRPLQPITVCFLLALSAAVGWHASSSSPIRLTQHARRLTKVTFGGDRTAFSKPLDWFLCQPSFFPPRHELPSKMRISQAPFVSGDTFRAMADYVFDETTFPPGAGWDAKAVQNGDVIFVKSDLLPHFFTTLHPNISSQYILISHNSDCAVPLDRRQPCDLEGAKYLNDSQLGHWYGQNMLQGYTRTTQIPIGVANRHWPHGDVDKLMQVAKAAAPWEQRPTLLYLGMDVGTHGSRSEVVASLSKIPGTRATKQRRGYQEYLTEVAGAKFVAAPRGNGLDTHRAWEAIYLGAVPILAKGPLDSMFKGMPVLLVDDYSRVDEALLQTYTVDWYRSQSTYKAWAIYWYHDLQQRKQLLHVV